MKSCYCAVPLKHEKRRLRLSARFKSAMSRVIVTLVALVGCAGVTVSGESENLLVLKIQQVGVLPTSPWFAFSVQSDGTVLF